MNDKFTGLLGDPMLQIGLGILANNTGNRGAFAPAFGRGVMQGMNNAQDFAQQQQMLGFRNQQADMQRQQFDLQKQAAEREKQQFDLQEKAIQDASKNNPELAGLFRLNPAAAIKATFPNANGADPYYTPIATESGLGTFNNRTGQFTPLNVNGKPIIKSTDSPALQGQISASKSYGENLYQPTDMQSGVIKNKSQLAIDAGAPMPSGYPSVTAGVQKQRDDKRMQILIAEQQAAGGRGKNPELDKEINNMKMRGFGVSVPTKAEEAAAVQTAKDQAEFNSPEATRKREQALTFKKTTGQNMMNTIQELEGRVSGTTAGIGGAIMSKLPINSDAYDLNADIETVKANFGFDRLQAMRDMSPTGGALGQVAVQELAALQASVSNLDPRQSPDQLKKNLSKAKGHYKNWLDTLDQQGTSAKPPSAPSSGATFNELPPPNKYKGKIIRNPDTGERMQSDGMRWKAL